MNILTGKTSSASVRPPAKALPALLERLPGKMPDWREVTVNEIAVELPQAAIDIFDVKEHNPVAGGVAQSAVSTLAFLRAYQGLSGPSLEQKMEGASSLALGLSGVISMFPGQFAANTAQALNLGQATLELSLGVRELHEEIFIDGTPDWKEIVSGSLDTIKGASAFVPLFFPATADIVTGVQVGAMLTKAAFESTIHRSTDE